MIVDQMVDVTNTVVWVRWCIVGCLGHYPLDVTHTWLSSRDAICMVVGWCGVLCENCIVDASIKPHACSAVVVASSFEVAAAVVVGVWFV